MKLRDFFVITTWWGKALGVFFGYLCGGPLGAILGLLVGNFFDRGLVTYYTNPHLHFFLEKRKAIQKIFFETTFLVMGHLAKADGRVSEQEIKMAKLLMRELRLSKKQKILAKQLFQEGKQAGFNLEMTLYNLKKACSDNHELLKLFADIQYRAAQADALTTSKIKLLNVILSCLGFAPLQKQNRFFDDFEFTSKAQEEYQRQYYQEQQKQKYDNKQSSSSQKQYYYHQQTPHNNLAQAYVLLDISSSASKQEVKRAYRRLISRNHPDKLIAKGLPEAMIKIANDKTQKIMKAYELICQSKGW